MKGSTVLWKTYFLVVVDLESDDALNGRFWEILGGKVKAAVEFEVNVEGC